MTGASPAFCTSCGTRATGARFCTSCGAALLPPAPAGDRPRPTTGPAWTDEGATQELPGLPATSAWTGSDGEQPTQVLPLMRSSQAPVEPSYASPPVPDLDRSGTAGRGSVGDDRSAGPVRRSRRGVVVLGAVLLVLALAAVGVLGVRHVRDAGVREALADATAAYNPVVDGLREADDLAAVGAAAGAAGPAAERVGRAAQTVGSRDDGRARAVRRELAAQQDVLTAAAALATVEEEPLETWSSAHRALRAAVDDERVRRADLRAQDGDGAAQVADGGEMMASLTSTVGSALSQEAAGATTQLLDAMAAATRTSELRGLADDAVARQDAVVSVAEALGSGPDQEALAAYGELLGALGGLSGLSAGDTTAWDAVRPELSQAAGRLAAGAGTHGDDVRGSLGNALDGVDALTRTAAEGFATWRASLDRATEQLAADRAGLATYRTAFDETAKDYADQRQQLADSLQQDDLGAYQAGYLLDGAVSDRLGVRDALRALSPPPSVADEHAQVVALVERAAEAVRSGYDGAAEATGCLQECDYRVTSGWARFQSESAAITGQYDDALSAWAAAMTAAAAELDARELPQEPDL